MCSGVWVKSHTLNTCQINKEKSLFKLYFIHNYQPESFIIHWCHVRVIYKVLLIHL